MISACGCGDAHRVGRGYVTHEKWLSWRRNRSLSTGGDGTLREAVRPVGRAAHVRTAELAPHLRRYIAESGATFESLAERAGINDKTVGNIYHERKRYTQEAIFDRLKTAMEMPHLDLEFVRKRKGQLGT